MKPVKSLFARRSRYVWLLLEIIVASAIAFYVLDPMVVSVYDSSRPYDFNARRMVLVKLRKIDHHNPNYDSARNGDSDALERDVYAITARLTATEGVEKAIPLPTRGFSTGDDSYAVLQLPDSTMVQMFQATFIPGTDFFTTMGLRAADDIPGNPTTEQMDDMHVDYYSENIVTRTFARLAYGDEYQAMALSRKRYDRYREVADSVLQFERWYPNPTDCEKRIVGIIEDTRVWGDRPWPIIKFYSDPLSHSIYWNESGKLYVGLLLEKGESVSRMVSRLNHDPEWQRLCSSGQLEFDEAEDYAKVCGADAVLSPKERYRNLLVVFFAANIFLGVFGTFWLLTRKRTEEAGILRAFGCTARGVRMMLYVEGAIISVIGSLLGCAVMVYYFFHHKLQLAYGLTYMAKSKNEVTDLTPGTDGFRLPDELANWVGNFWEHCVVITAVVILLMLIVTLLGIAIPAWRLSRIHPVTALRDE